MESEFHHIESIMQDAHTYKVTRLRGRETIDFWAVMGILKESFGPKDQKKGLVRCDLTELPRQVCVSILWTL